MKLSIGGGTKSDFLSVGGGGSNIVGGGGGN